MLFRGKPARKKIVIIPEEDIAELERIKDERMTIKSSTVYLNDLIREGISYIVRMGK